MKPSMEQLKEAIAKCKDTDNWRLILKQDASFELVRFNNTEDAILFRSLQYVTRWETFDAGNDFVGIEASKDNGYLEKIMDWAMEAWKKYQETEEKKILNP